LNAKLAPKSVLMALLLSLLVMVSGVAHLTVFSSNFGGSTDSLQRSATVYPPGRVFLNQTFDNETIGTIPDGWYIANSQYGNITVANGGYGSTRKSAMVIDNSSVGSPGPYRYFAEQTKTIGMSFAIEPTNNSGSNTVVEVYVDDGNFNGASIIFKDGKIGYRQKYGGIFILRSSYVPNRWYGIKLILNIPRNVYNVYIDNHLEAVDVGFLGACTQLHRIAFNETSGQDGLFLPVAYVDEILGRQVIEIPRDYSTIQEGVNAANQGDVVFVTGQRTYYESVSITKSIELVGEDVTTTVIDGSLAPPKSISDGVSIQADNVLMHEFTVRSTPYGAGIHVQGSNNIIENNIVTNGLGDGINIIGSSDYLARNVIKTNMKCGVRISGSDCTLTDNTIIENDACGVLVSGSNSNVSDNFIGSNLDCGIWIAAGDQNVLWNNAIKKNLVGVKCEAATKDNKIYQNRFIGNGQTPQAIDSGANKWDDGYPYSPNNKTGGGNYWSDYDCFDIYRGANQDRLCPLCFPSPDGIADRPYNLSLRIQDRYPLFLIQNISQDPDNVKYDVCGCPLHYVDYDVAVTVTGKMLDNVTVVGSFFLVDSDSNHANITMKNAGDNVWKGTIPGKKYGVEIRYNVSAHAESAIEVNSTDYPLTGPYFVDDHTPPRIDNASSSPPVPDERQPIIVSAHVTEPLNASGVAGVFLSYKFNDTWWVTNMTKSYDDVYTASIPPQPGNMTLFFYVSAVDNAGNGNPGIGNNTKVNNLPTLFVTSASNATYATDPCDIDLSVMYRGEKRNSTDLTLFNIGQENLAWNITLIKDGDWLKSTLPAKGVILPGKNVTITISVDTTTCIDPNLYVAELAISANGSMPRWAAVVRLIVRDIVIDTSWASKPSPQRSNVDETQYFAFHAKWTHNCTEAVSGKINVNNGVGLVMVNGTGWANFNYTSQTPTQKVFSVTDVDFNYAKDNQVYHIKSFTQNAENLATIWDRAKINLTIINSRIDVGSAADITWKGSIYESDNSPFIGFPSFNYTLVKDNVGRYCITTSSINDTQYGLTVFQSNIVCCIWDEIKINVGGVSNRQPQVGKRETVWVVAIYEYDNMLLKEANGTLFLNVYELDGNTQSWQPIIIDDKMDWSPLYDRWEKSHSFDTQGTRRFTVSRVRDNMYNLTAINDLAGPIDITWLGGGWGLWPWASPGDNTNVSGDAANTTSDSQMLPVQGALKVPFWAITGIIVTLAIGLAFIFAIVVKSGKKRKSKDPKNSMRHTT